MRNNLALVYRRFAKETALIEQAFEMSTNQALAGTDGLNRRLVQEMCLIRLQDSWGRFCRRLVVFSCWAQPKTAQGFRVPRAPGIRRSGDVIPKLMSTYRRRTTEPEWHIPAECLDAATRLQIINLPSVNSGLALSFPNSTTDQPPIPAELLCASQ